jgi:hypothetical protein
MIWRVILFWLLGANLAWADLPRHFSVASVASCKDLTALLNYWGHPLDGYSYQNDALGLGKTRTASRRLGDERREESMDIPAFLQMGSEPVKLPGALQRLADWRKFLCARRLPSLARRFGKVQRYFRPAYLRPLIQ